MQIVYAVVSMNSVIPCIAGIAGIVGKGPAHSRRGEIEGMADLLVLDDGNSQAGFSRERENASLVQVPWIPTSGTRYDRGTHGVLEGVAYARLDLSEDDSKRMAGAPFPDRNPTALELLLRAYRHSKEKFLPLLAGDFSFAIWDQGSQRLLCARDQIGIQPFFYAPTSDGIVFSNVLDAVLSHPAVDRRLDDFVLADYLVFGRYLSLAATPYRGIFRLPPAHFLSWTPSGISIGRYWKFEGSDQGRHAPMGDDVVECFLELFQRAVSSRCHPSSFISLSGGLDSTSIGAVASESAVQPSGAVTVSWESVIPDREREFAEIAARSWGLPLEVFDAGAALMEASPVPDVHPPDLAYVPVFPVERRFRKFLSERTAYVLTGDGGDEALDSPRRFFPRLLERGYYLRFAREMLDFRRAHGYFVRPGIRSAWRVARIDQDRDPPPWIREDWFEASGYRERWDQEGRPDLDGPLHRVRAKELITTPLFVLAIERNSISATQVPVDFRMPYLDIRLLEFLHRTYFRGSHLHKGVLRLALGDKLPPRILNRRKTPLSEDPFRSSAEEMLKGAFVSPRLEHIVDGRQFPLALSADPTVLYSALRAVVVNRWVEANLTWRTV